MEENGVPRETNRSDSSHWQTLSHNVVMSTFILMASVILFL